jgi:N-sulfoglucosamine sulfohydrolase
MNPSCWLGIALLLLPYSGTAAARNVLMVVTDDLGTDLGCYGSSVVRTPHLDRLAAEGTRFTHAFCTTASCSASRSVILGGLHNHATGQYGHQHSYHNFHTFENIRTLPVLLANAGYRTARIGKFHVQPEAVYRFEEVLDRPPEGRPVNARNPAAMAERARPFLGREDPRPFFLYFCTTDPHRSGVINTNNPHRPDRFGNGPVYPGIEEVLFRPDAVVVPPFLPDTPATRAELAEYYQSVVRIDQGMGRLFEVLRETGHYDDLTPTILDFAGVPYDVAQFHGRSFLPMLEQEDPEGWDEVYASHTFHEITMYYPMRVVRTRRRTFQ